MNLAPKILFLFPSLVMACAPLAASAVIPPPATPLYVGNYQTIEIDKIDGLGNSTLFAYPGLPAVAMAFDGSGNLYAATEANVINEYNPQGNGTVFANSGLNIVTGMAFGTGGNLFVANGGSGAGTGYIEKYNSSGVGSLFAMTGTIQPYGGLAFDNNGNLFVAEEGNGTIVKYNSQGIGTPFVGGLYAYSMAYYNNYLYVATASDAIYKVNSLGNATLFANTDLSDPAAMAFDADGDLFVVNGNNKTIAEFNSQGNGSIFATESYSMNAIAIVPEPATWTILALGVGAIIGRRRLFSRGA
jgi:WD40 repeat protein